MIHSYNNEKETKREMHCFAKYKRIFKENFNKDKEQRNPPQEAIQFQIIYPTKIWECGPYLTGQHLYQKRQLLGYKTYPWVRSKSLTKILFLKECALSKRKYRIFDWWNHYHRNPLSFKNVGEITDFFFVCLRTAKLDKDN